MTSNFTVYHVPAKSIMYRGAPRRPKPLEARRHLEPRRAAVLFELCCWWSPFYAEDTQQMYKNICFGKIRFLKDVIGEEGKLFVQGHRLGAINDVAELKMHPFFKLIDWPAISRKQVTPPSTTVAFSAQN